MNVITRVNYSELDGLIPDTIRIWLEKQGEQKPADKVKPKFHEGDWIINSQGTLRHIINVDKGGYQTDGGWLTHDTYEKTFHLWTIQDAKDGDVLVSESKCGLNTWYCIFKSLDDDESMTVHCYIGRDGRFQTMEELCFDKDPRNVNPATKEQRDLLFQKMKEAGYEWDAEKKELKKIEQQPILDVEIPFGAKDSELEEVSYNIPNGYHAEIEDNKVVIKKGEQKPAEWSEEIEAAISLLKDIAEEQEKDYCPHNANDLRKAAIYLETCRSQSTLKPSDKHYELEEFARVVRGNLTGISKTVQKLFEAKYLQLTGRKMYIGFKD